MVLTNEVKDYFSKLIEPLAKSENINDLFEKFKTDVLSKLEERISQQDNKIENWNQDSCLVKTSLIS